MTNAVKRFFIGDHRNMKPLIRQFSLGAVAIAMAQVTQAALSVTNIVPMQIPGQGTEIRVMFNGLPPQPQAYQTDNPSRLILDFDQAGQNLQQKNIPVATNEANSVDVSSDAQRSRLTVNLNNAGEFATRVEGNTFILKINAPTAKTSIAQKTVRQQGLSHIDFHRSKKGEGQIVLDLLSSNTPVDVQQKGSKIVVRLLGNKVPSHLARRLNVNDFATPVNTVDAFNDGTNGVVEIQTAGSFDYMAYQTDRKLTINVARKEESKPFDPQSLVKKYTGKKVSLDFQDIEVRRVLQLLADFTGVNIVAADTVQGNITLRLKDVPWDQALDLILKTKNLDKRSNGDVIWIAPTAEIAKYEADQAKAYEQSVRLAPLQTEYIQLNYTRAKDLEKIFKDSESKNNANGEGERENSLLSSRGRAVTDERTNTVIITDTAAKVDQFKNIIKQLDIPVRQVMVEARIVRANTSVGKSLGIKWGYFSTNGAGFASNTSNLMTARNNKYAGEDETIKNNLNVDLGSTMAGSSSIAFGLINTASTLLNLELSALQSDGLGEILSTPKVMTGDKQEAIIRSGVKLPYRSVSDKGTNTIFQDAVIELKVIPSITPEGTVQMKLDISKDAVGSLTDAGYAIDMNALQTNVLVNDGETVVLGGLYEDETTNKIDKVPFLGDLPAVGNLFKNRTKSQSKRELLIFITPRIINDSFSRNH